jgi:hypothetical protein
VASCVTGPGAGEDQVGAHWDRQLSGYGKGKYVVIFNFIVVLGLSQWGTTSSI